MHAYIVDHYVPLVRVWNGKRGFDIAECKGYDANGCFSHKAAMRVALAIKKSINAEIERQSYVPPVPTSQHSLLSNCFVILLSKLILTICK